jgi:hypothetical protein
MIPMITASRTGSTVFFRSSRIHLNCLVIFESFPGGEKLPLYWSADFIRLADSKKDKLDKKKMLPKDIIRYNKTTPIIEQLGTCLIFSFFKPQPKYTGAKICINPKNGENKQQQKRYKTTIKIM